MALIFGCEQPQPAIKPTYTQLTVAVYASATIVPDDQYTVYPAVTGIIERKYIEQGDTVEIGAPLFALQNTTPQINQESSQISVDQAQKLYQGQHNILQELAQQIEKTTLKLIQDSIDYQRQKRLWAQNIGTKRNLEQSGLAFQLTQRDLKSLQNQYQRTEDDLAHQLRLAEKQYEKSSASAKEFIIRSQLHGIVYSVQKQKGEAVSPQTPLASIGTAQAFKVEMLVDEVDITQVKLGQTVVFSLDAYPDEVFEGAVVKITPTLDRRSQTLLVEANLKELPPQLYNGMTGEANIIVNEKQGALVIPKSYLFNGQSVITTNRDTVAVKIGLSNLEWIEVLTGIDSATTILKPE